MSKPVLRGTVPLVLFVFIACGDDTPPAVCDPGGTITCDCPGGTKGQASCDESGVAGECMCTPTLKDAGVTGTDASTPSDAATTDLGTPSPDAAPTPDAAPADAAPADAMTVDAAPADASTSMDASSADVGPPDAGGLDAGMPDTGVVSMNDQEGGPCVPDATPQGSCQAGLTCVVWDPNTVPTPLASCVRECTQDADCAASVAGNTLCRNLGLDSDPFMICTAEEGVEDELCVGAPFGFDPLRGCAAGLDCLVGFFTDLAAYEGLCIQLCDPTGVDPQGACTNANFPYCNPRFVTLTSTNGTQTDYGYCADGQHTAGAPCRGQGLTGRCDTDPASGDLGCVGGLAPQGQGSCFEFCDLSAANPTCQHSDPNLGTAQCNILDQGPACQNDGDCTSAGWELCAPDGFCGIADGVCTLPCSVFPEDCSGAGEPGLGRTCIGGVGFDLDGDGNFAALDLCLDILPPLWSETTLELDANNMIALQTQGDDCAGGILSCPDYTTCVSVQVGVAVCLRGCNTATSAQDPRGGCESDPNRPNTFCSDDFFPTPPQGVCVDP